MRQLYSLVGERPVHEKFRVCMYAKATVVHARFNT